MSHPDDGELRKDQNQRCCKNKPSHGAFGVLYQFDRGIYNGCDGRGTKQQKDVQKDFRMQQNL
jgi:polyphosphate kinase 2 (PPK2 family)